MEFLKWIQRILLKIPTKREIWFRDRCKFVVTSIIKILQLLIFMTHTKKLVTKMKSWLGLAVQSWSHFQFSGGCTLQIRHYSAVTTRRDSCAYTTSKQGLDKDVSSRWYNSIHLKRLQSHGQNRSKVKWL